MKRFCIFFLLSIIISVSVGLWSGCSLPATQNSRYLRIHIRADSDTAEAQAVKYAVKNEVVDYLTPKLCQAENFADATRLLEGELSALQTLSNAVLRGQGFDYEATATLQTEYFPTRKYGEYVLEEGSYLALIIRLGKGEGQNWWCVVYPPLCFASQTGVPIVYKSKLVELIERWKAGE